MTSNITDFFFIPQGKDVDRLAVILPSNTAMRRAAVPGSAFGIARIIITAVHIVIGLTGADPVPEQYPCKANQSG